MPDSVNRLRPGDIDVIAAMGDSITTGAGLLATNTMQLSIENRGMMATIGGEETWRKVLTLPNIFKVRSSIIDHKFLNELKFSFIKKIFTLIDIMQNFEKKNHNNL